MKQGVYVIVSSLPSSPLGILSSLRSGISVEVQQSRISDQLHHLENMLISLTAARPSWLLVAGHYPIFSAGSHGDSTELKTYLLPLLTSYGVDAYLCGHDHVSEHLIHNHTHFFVAGAGALTDSLQTSPSTAASLQVRCVSRRGEERRGG